MKLRNLISLSAIVLLTYALSTIGSSCAQIGMPTGGLRDSIPPVLVKSTPVDRTLNFKEKTIILNFDEYVTLKDIQENMIVSPTPIINPLVTSKLRTIKILLKDTLQPNTTYSIGLGNSIQDVNENNPYKDFHYVFSTGPYIDSLTFTGSVQLAETGKKDSTLIALLYNDLSDSAVLKKKARYVAKLDSSGNFSFRNLAPGTYHVFAVKDESGQKMYSDPKQLFGFLDSSVVIAQNNAPVKLFAYAEEKEVPKPSTSGGSKNAKPIPLKMTNSLTNKVQDLLTGLTLDFNKPLKSFDSAKIRLTDTLYNDQPFTIAFEDTLNQKIKIKKAWREDFNYKLIVEKEFAVDTLGEMLAANDTISFKTKKETEYGSIKVNFKNLDKFKHPVLQIIFNNIVINSYPLNSSVFTLKLIPPGEYTLRMLDDTNQNGVWNPGNYMKKIQPEIVTDIPNKLSLRANWDNETDVIL